ncbi:carbonic anhydrase 4 [Hyla sarda]|uniref:carbonic anhydrase 4 n=1 Tax=Hyla sarda TaxID=327740 RepID=UPI0024C2687C|nr:carbonic anhydrase 4 [Hyla sarda]
MCLPGTLEELASHCTAACRGKLEELDGTGCCRCEIHLEAQLQCNLPGFQTRCVLLLHGLIHALVVLQKSSWWSGPDREEKGKSTSLIRENTTSPGYIVIYITNVDIYNWCYEIQTVTDSSCKVPTKWSGFCGEKKQSPINVITCDAEFDSKLKPFKFEGYDKAQNCLLKNNGHSAELELEGKETIAISGGGLSGTYIATQLHFHWGSKDNPGSEHSLNGEKYPIELHIVHKKKEARSESGGGSNSSDGLAVLGFFLEEGSENGNYSNLIKGFREITKYGTNTTISNVKLQDLIPKEDQLKLFYRYSGSLTTPQCNETVVWTVFPTRIKLSTNQIAAFYSSLNYTGGQTMTNNFRPLQKLNGRTIYTSGGIVILPQARYLLIALFVFCLTSMS